MSKKRKKEVKPKKKEIQVQDIEELDTIKEEEERVGAESPTDEKGKALFSPPPQPVKLVRQTNHNIDYKPPEKISYEDMRKQRIQQRIADRSIKIQNLFNNAI